MNLPRDSTMSRPRASLPIALAVVLAGGCTVDDDGGECPPGDPVAVASLGPAEHLRDPRPLSDLLDAPVPRPDVPVPPSDPVDPVRPVEVGEPVPIDGYALSMGTSTTSVGTGADVGKASFPWLDALVPRARALSCAEAVRSVSRLDGLTLVSDRALGPDLPAGTDLADVAFIDARPAVYRLFESDGTIPGNRFDPSGPPPRLADWRAASPLAPLAFAIRLDAPGIEPGAHVLTVTYALEGSEAFVVSTDPVTLVP